MIRMIHSGDIHLGSPMDSRLPREKAEERRKELRSTFLRMVEFAEREEVSVILLCGDLFDSDRPLKKEKEFFYDVVRRHPGIDFLYLRGNHDRRESYVEEQLPKNLKTFGDSWSKYTYGNVDVYGIEMGEANAHSLYASLNCDPERCNLVLLHGTLSDSVGNGMICRSRLRGRGIDYLALGHYHSYEQQTLDERGLCCYCGCLEGRGFDEAGEKGFVILSIDRKVESRFIPFSFRKIQEFTVDLTGTEGVYDAVCRIREQCGIAPENLLRVTVTGAISYGDSALSGELETYLREDYYVVSVRDCTEIQIDPESYAGQVSLRGEFVRTVLADTSCTEEEKMKILAFGLKALNGNGVD